MTEMPNDLTAEEEVTYLKGTIAVLQERLNARDMTVQIWDKNADGEAEESTLFAVCSDYDEDDEMVYYSGTIEDNKPTANMGRHIDDKFLIGRHVTIHRPKS